MNINIKEAGRYSNYFQSLLQDLNRIHNNIAGNLHKQTEVHRISQALEGGIDKTEEIVINSKYKVTPEKIEELITAILTAKLELSNSIAQAKIKMNVSVDGIDYAYDTAIEHAKTLRNISGGFYQTLDRSYKESIEKRTGMDYTFNIEKNQVAYRYSVEVTTELLFNKEEFKRSDKSLKGLANKLSIEVEQMSIKKTIEFETEFDYLDTLEEVIEKFAN